MNFWQPRWNFFQGSRNYFWSMFKTDEIFLSSKKKYLCPQKVPMDTQKAVLTSSRKTFFEIRTKNFRSRSQTDEGEVFLTEQQWYFSMFLWLRTLRFWQSGRVFSDWRGFISTQCSSIIKTIMFLGITAGASFVPRDIYIAFLTTPPETFRNKVAEVSIVV